MRQVPSNMAAKLLAAAEPIADRGLDNTTMEDFAAATGIARATLYYYFDGKEEILSYIFEVLFDETAEAVAKGLSSSGTAADRLARVVEAHLQVFERYPKACLALHFDIGRAARRPNLAERIRSTYVNPVSDLLVCGARDGSLRRVNNPKLTAVAIMGATTVTATHVLAIDKASLDGLSKVVVPVILKGLEPRKRAGPKGS